MKIVPAQGVKALESLQAEKGRVIRMIQRRIMLRPNDVNEFVKVASACDFDIDVAYNRYVVDAKSILGVLGLDLTKALTVTYQGYNEKLENFIAGTALAC